MEFNSKGQAIESKEAKCKSYIRVLALTKMLVDVMEWKQVLRKKRKLARCLRIY